MPMFYYLPIIVFFINNAMQESMPQYFLHFQCYIVWKFYNFEYFSYTSTYRYCCCKNFVCTVQNYLKNALVKVMLESRNMHRFGFVK